MSCDTYLKISIQMATAVTGATGIFTKTQGLTRSVSLVRMMSGTAATGTPGEGAGKGGGGGGSVRDAGGSMGKRQAAQEEQYFRQEQQKQIEEYKEKQKEAAQKVNSQK